MASDNRIYFDLSPELRDLLDDRDLTVSDMLADAGVEVRVLEDALPPERPDERSRVLVPVIYAASVAAVSGAMAVAIVTSAIARFLDRLAARPRYVEFQERRPVLDAAGNPVVLNGKVQTIRVPVHRFVEPKNLDVESFTYGWNPTRGVVVRFDSGKRPEGRRGADSADE